MLRAGVLSALLVLLPGPGLPAAAETAGATTVFEMPLPGGVDAAMKAVGDNAAADRGQFLFEFIRRTHSLPQGPLGNAQDAVLAKLLAHLDQHQHASSAAGDDTLPLPLPPDVWIDAVFGGQATHRTLATDILRSRAASLLYYGLLSLDDETRRWLAGHPDLVAQIAATFPAAFVAAAPGLRVSSGVILAPGGPAAAPVWRALTGTSLDDPPAFVRALLSGNEGRLALFFGSIAQLSDRRIAFALNLDEPEGGRVAAARRLLGIFVRLGHGWKVENRAFWRPMSDPVLLLRDLTADAEGRVSIPGTRPFWTDVFAESRGRTGAAATEADSRRWASGQPADFVWMSEQVFRDPLQQDARYQAVLFASRMIPNMTSASAPHAFEAVRGLLDYPALVQMLERAQLHDVGAIAAAVRRASALSDIRDTSRAARAIIQYQGAVSLLTRAALRGSLRPRELAAAVTSLAAVETDGRGEYGGRLVRWVDTLVTAQSRATVRAAPSADEPGTWRDDELLRLMSGRSMPQAPLVEWEGTHYRVDLAWAEEVRLRRLLGRHPHPYLSAASALVDLADAAGQAHPDPALVRAAAGRFTRLSDEFVWSDDAGVPGHHAPDGYSRVAPPLRSLASGTSPGDLARLGEMAAELADRLLARGLTELAYAAALGDPERTMIDAAEAAGRHDLGLRSLNLRYPRAWQMAVHDARSDEGWRMSGSLLGLDIRLSDLSLRHVSSKPPARPPSLSEQDRRAMIEAVALVQADWLNETDRTAIAAAIRAGRARLAAVRTADDARAIGEAIGLGPVRRTLLPWVLAHDPERLPAFLSPSELLWLGLDGGPFAPSLHAWGAPARARLGCYCLRLTEARAWEAVAGRWHTGMLATAFSDLNLRLAELLSELQMPAALLAPVLAPATLDFVNTAVSRDPDDRRGPVEFVQALGPDRVEQYLALLTTDGPLVPLEDGEVGRVERAPWQEVPR